MFKETPTIAATSAPIETFGNQIQQHFKSAKIVLWLVSAMANRSWKLRRNSTTGTPFSEGPSRRRFRNGSRSRRPGCWMRAFSSAAIAKSVSLSNLAAYLLEQPSSPAL